MQFKEWDAELWQEWEAEEADNLKRIDSLIQQGHSRYCATLRVWGHRECVCSKSLEEDDE